MKNLLFCFMISLLCVLEASPLLDLSRAGISLDGGDGRQTILSEEQGTALHSSRIWHKGARLHRRIHKGHEAYKHNRILNTPAGVKLVTAKEFASIKFPDGVRSNFSTRLFHRLKLKPEYAGKRLVISFKIKGKYYSAPSSNYLYGGIIFGAKGKKKSVSHLSKRAMPRKTAVVSFSAPIPAGMEYADLHMALYGCGEMEIQSASIKLNVQDNAMSPDVIVSTSGYTDGEFHLPYQKSFPVKFAFRREFSFKPKTVRLFIELPKGFSCTGYGLEMKRLKDHNGVLVFDAKAPYRRTITRNTFCNWLHNAVLIRADLKPSEKFYTMRYWMSADGQRSVPRALKLKVLPFETHKAPRMLKSGLHYPSFNGTRFDAAGSEAFVEMYKNCGFNLISARIFPELSNFLRKAKIERVGNAMPMRNGYSVYAAVPVDQSFLDINGKPIARAYCPAAVYNRMSAYRKSVVEFCRKHLGPGGLYDHASGNWEPYIYDYKGCFCRRCGEEFARYAKLEWKDVEKIWPKKVLTVHRQKWLAFRSWQHGKVILTIQEDVKNAGLADNGKRSYFIPDISYFAFTKVMAGSYTGQYNARDYLKDLDSVCIWGPYAHKAALHSKYFYVPAQHLPHLLVCAKVNENVRSQSRAKIMGLPQGSHVAWVTTPEAIVFETLSGFVFGHAMSVPYWFAYDYRAYREMGRMNTLLSRIENFLTDGKSSAAVKGTPVTPYLESRHWRAVFSGTSRERILPELMKSSALQLRRLDLGKKSLVAAANTWEKGGVFFKLQLPDFKGNGSYVITDVQKGISLRTTGAELGKGVELFVKELTWAFFLVEPFEKGKNYNFTTASKIAGQKKKLLPVLKKAAAEEDKLLKESGPAQVNAFDFSAMPEIRAGNLLCRKLAGSATGVVEIIGPGYRIEVDPAVNGRIRSWKVGNRELAAASPEFGFGVIGCWMPHRRPLRGKYILTNVENRNGKLCLELKLASDRRNSFEVNSRYIFDDTGFRQEAEVINRGKLPTDIMLRFHAFSSALAGGRVMGGTKVLPVLPKVVLFRNGEKNENTEFPLRAEESYDASVERCVITPANASFKLLFNASELYGVLMWNNPGFSVASFEPTFSPVRRVQPGKSVKAAQEWHIVK